MQAWRLDARQLEFERWYTDCRRDRYVLTALASVVLAVIAVFTLQICLMAAAAFTLEQSVEWVVDVAQSIAVQVLVAGPAVDLLLFLLKLLLSWLLLRVGRRRQFLQQRQVLKAQAARLARRESSVADAASAAIARADALQVVAAGDEQAVRAERTAQLQAKGKHEARLSDVVAEKTRLLAQMAQLERQHHPHNHRPHPSPPPHQQQHPAAVAVGAAASASKPVPATVAVLLKEMRDEKLVLDADERRTVTLLNAVKVRRLLLLPLLLLLLLGVVVVVVLRWWWWWWSWCWCWCWCCCWRQ
jgi:hypothetical protein